MTIDQTVSIFAVVVTFNGSKTICDCLDSLQRSSCKVETVVIDNASIDNTVSIIKQYSEVVFFPQVKNLGFGQANNIGIKYALENGADFVFLLNQDAMIDLDTVEKLIDVSLKNPEFGIISPLHLNGDGFEIDKNVIDYIGIGAPGFISDAYFNRLKEFYSVQFINAAAWLITRKCIQLVGGFDSLFFMYGEDDDYCFRAQARGLKIGLVPSSVVYHKRTNSKPSEYKWIALKQEAIRRATMVVVSLKKTNQRFSANLILWGIDHFAKILRALVKLNYSELIILLMIKALVGIKLPRIRKHWKLSQDGSLFLNKE